jgi:hypothetical protein
MSSASFRIHDAHFHWAIQERGKISAAITATAEQGFEACCLQRRLVIPENFQTGSLVRASVKNAGYLPFQVRLFPGHHIAIVVSDNGSQGQDEFIKLMDFVAVDKRSLVTSHHRGVFTSRGVRVLGKGDWWGKPLLASWGAVQLLPDCRDI